jgi:hypothetical protein
MEHNCSKRFARLPDEIAAVLCVFADDNELSFANVKTA